MVIVAVIWAVQKIGNIEYGNLAKLVWELDEPNHIETKWVIRFVGMDSLIVLIAKKKKHEIGLRTCERPAEIHTGVLLAAVALKRLFPFRLVHLLCPRNLFNFSHFFHFAMLTHVHTATLLLNYVFMCNDRGSTSNNPVFGWNTIETIIDEIDKTNPFIERVK